MELRFTQVLAGGRQAQRFLDDHDGLLHEVNVGGARKEFDVGVTRLATLADEQTAHVIRAAGELESERRIARDLRRVNIRPVVRVARLKVPAAAQLTAVQLPPRRSNNTDLATRARAMGAAVAPYKALFHEGGLPADFIERLEAGAAALEAAVSKKQSHQVGRTGATTNIAVEVSDMRQQLAAVDALVRAVVAENEPLLGEWQAIVRNMRRAVRSSTQQPVVAAA